MASNTPPPPTPVEIIASVSEETLTGFAQMAPDDLTLCMRMLTGVGLQGLATALDQVLHPEAAA